MGPGSTVVETRPTAVERDRVCGRDDIGPRVSRRST